MCIFGLGEIQAYGTRCDTNPYGNRTVRHNPEEGVIFLLDQLGLCILNTLFYIVYGF